MSLADKLAATRAASATRIPPDKAAIMDRIVKVGGTAPAFSLASYDGSRVASADLLAKGPLVLSFFRGSW